MNRFQVCCPMHFDTCVHPYVTISQPNFGTFPLTQWMLLCLISTELLPWGNIYSDPYHYSLVLPILEFHINKIRHYVLYISFPCSICLRDPHSCYCIYQKFVPFFFFFCRVVLHFISITKPVYPVICWWTFGFFPVWRLLWIIIL